MSSCHKLVWSAALGYFLALSACNSTTAPVSLADPLATAAQAAALDSAFASPVVASFQALGSRIDATPAPPLITGAVGALRLAPLVSLADEGRALRQAVSSLASLAATGIFPPTLLGAVFSWDPNLHSYYVSSPTGGPSNGIRFLLYAINPLTDEPATPLDQIGYVDLMDESSGGIARLHIQVKDKGETVTYLDYLFSGSGTSTMFSASVTGTITNGLGGAANKTLTFSVAITGNASSVTLTATYTLNNPSVTVQETVTVADDGTTTTLTLDFTFSRTGQTVQIVGTVTASDATGSGTVNISFKVNGSTFATLTGTTSNLALTKTGGGQLTAGEQLALASLFEVAANAAEKIGDLFQPAERTLGF